MGNQHADNKQPIINHPILKNSQIHLNKGQIKSFVPLLDQSDLADWVDHIQRIKNLESDFLFNPERYSIQNRSMCGNSCLIKLTYSIYPYLLIDEILNRRHLKRQFQQNQLWYILYALSESSNHFHHTNHNLGDIRPHNILFNEIGQLKIIHRFSWPGELSNFQKTKFENKITYLSPQQVNLLCAGKTFNSTDPIKSQSFSIGLTLLSALYLRDFSDLYDATYMNFDMQEFRNFVEKINQCVYTDQQTDKTYQYSSQILKIMQRLCDPDYYSRLSIIQTYHWLLPFKKQIINFQPFRLRIFENHNANESLNYNNETSQKISERISEVDSKPQLQLNTHKILADTKMHKRASRSNTMNIVPIKLEDLSGAQESVPSPMMKILPLKQDVQRTQSQKVDIAVVKKQRQYSDGKYRQISSIKNGLVDGNLQKKRQDEMKIEELQMRSSAPKLEMRSQTPKLERALVSIVPTPKNGKQLFSDVKMVSTYSKYPEDDELLRKIEEQLKRSRNMFPS